MVLQRRSSDHLSWNQSTFSLMCCSSAALFGYDPTWPEATNQAAWEPPPPGLNPKAIPISKNISRGRLATIASDGRLRHQLSSNCVDSSHSSDTSEHPWFG